MTEEILEFGARAPGVEYRLRPGGYVVLRNATGEIAVLETTGGVHLPGGGQEPGETIEDAARREALEESGFRVAIEACIGVADELVFGGEERAYFRKRCSFFMATVVARDGADSAEAEAEWLEPSLAIARLTDGSQRWAVARAFFAAPKSDSKRIDA